MTAFTTIRQYRAQRICFGIFVSLFWCFTLFSAEETVYELSQKKIKLLDDIIERISQDKYFLKRSDVKAIELEFSDKDSIPFHPQESLKESKRLASLETKAYLHALAEKQQEVSIEEYVKRQLLKRYPPIKKGDKISFSLKRMTQTLKVNGIFYGVSPDKKLITVDSKTFSVFDLPPDIVCRVLPDEPPDKQILALLRKEYMTQIDRMLYDLNNKCYDDFYAQNLYKRGFLALSPQYDKWGSRASVLKKKIAKINNDKLANILNSLPDQVSEYLSSVEKENTPSQGVLEIAGKLVSFHHLPHANLMEKKLAEMVRAYLDKKVEENKSSLVVSDEDRNYYKVLAATINMFSQKKTKDVEMLKELKKTCLEPVKSEIAGLLLVDDFRIFSIGLSEADSYEKFTDVSNDFLHTYKHYSDAPEEIRKRIMESFLEKQKTYSNSVLIGIIKQCTAYLSQNQKNATLRAVISILETNLKRYTVCDVEVKNRAERILSLCNDVLRSRHHIERYSCTQCRGRGYIIESTSYGVNISEPAGPFLRSTPTVITSQVRCSQCGGSGQIVHDYYVDGK